MRNVGYRKVDSYLKNILADKEIYFASPRKYNDPFDSKIQFDPLSNQEERQDLVAAVVKEQRPNLNAVEVKEYARQLFSQHSDVSLDKIVNEVTDSLLDEMACLSLSETSNDILMWAHYGDGHRGVCLEFDNEHDPFKLALPVAYAPEYPAVKFVMSESEKWPALLLTKSDHWRYEEEWRVILTNQAPGARPFASVALTGIIFGCQITDNNRKLVRSWVQSGHCKPVFYRAKVKTKEFGLDIEITG